MNKNFEYRNEGEIGILEDSRTVVGYASVFGVRSNPLMGKLNGKDILFTETIEAGAFDGLIDKSDVVACFNHETDNGILARSKNGVGTLQLEIDERGLKYTFELPNTAQGDMLLESLKRGDIDSSSFAFIVLQGGETWTRESDGIYSRSISKIGKLVDIAIVVRPAYNEASVNLRGLESTLEIEQQEELESYFTELTNLIK